ncbi:MAG: ABC transporter ATP-binding protein/permease [Candidatus Dormibacteraeota bacterium]|nr:ABC transporter ATP-binding protein/permease [Candidatus Dormibacteraeota bacterium]
MRERARAVLLVLTTAFRTDPWRATAVLVMNLGVSLSSVLFGLWLKFLVDGATRHDMAMVIFSAVAIAVSFAFLMIAAMSQYVFASRLSEETAQAFDEELMSISARLPGLEHHELPEYLDKLNLLRTDRWTLSSSVWAVFINIGLVAQVAGSVILLARLDLLLLLLPVFAVPYVVLGGKAQMLGLSAGEKAAEAGRLAQTVRQLGLTAAPAKEIRISGLQDTLRRHHRAAADAALAPMARAQARGALYSAAGSVIFAAGFIGATLLVVVRASRGQATLGDVVLAMTLASQVNQQVAGAVGAVSWLLQTLRGISRFLWLKDYAAVAVATRPASAPVPDRIGHGIDFEGVTFRYPGTDIDVLKDFSLHIPAGSTVAVVGENGAGKTSLVKLLERFYEPTAGRILVDGVDIAGFSIEQWRERHSACFQDFANFAFVLRETVGVGDLPRVDDLPRVEAALAAANASDVPERLERGLNAQLSRLFEGGVDLSGGQWQKLALGRAMMRDEPLLLALDEPSSGLDAQAEHSLFERYAGAAHRSAARNGAITVLVSHRFSTVRMADLIVVINEGRPAEVGTHAELMARRGLYAELYEIQASAYR